MRGELIVHRRDADDSGGASHRPSGCGLVDVALRDQSLDRGPYHSSNFVDFGSALHKHVAF